MSNTSADHATALGALGFVSGHNVSTRWSHPSLNTSNLVMEYNNLDEIQHCLCDARRQHTSAQQTRAGTRQHVPHPVSPCPTVFVPRPHSEMLPSSSSAHCVEARKGRCYDASVAKSIVFF